MFKSQAGVAHILFLILILIGIGIGLYLVQNPQVFSPKAATTTPATTASSYLPTKPEDLRCITYFDFDYTSDVQAVRDTSLDYLNKQIPIWKSNGFNCVAFVLNWNFMQPRAYPTPVWDEERVRSVTRMFDSLKNNNMGIMMGLNFVHFAPLGFNPTNPKTATNDGEPVECDFLRDATMYGAFEKYTHEVFARFQNYPMFYHVFTDNALPCVVTLDPAGAALMRRTLGSLPSRIPPELRSKIIIGFHDVLNVRPYNPRNPVYSSAYTQAEMSPVQDVTQFDFYSQQVYEGNSTIDEFMVEMDDWVKYMRNFFGPNMPPLIFGELGSTLVRRKPEGGLVTQVVVEEELVNGVMTPVEKTVWVCDYDERSEMIQRNALYFMTKYAMTNKIGFSIWAWQYQDNTPTLDCRFGAHALTRPNGSPRPAVAAIKQAILEGGVQLDTAASSGQISASPAHCVLTSGQSACTSTISWSTSNLSDVEVKVSQGNQLNLQFSTQPNGTAQVPWITADGAKFDLYGNSGSGKVVVQSLTVKAVNPSSSPLHNPSPSLSAKKGDLDNDGDVDIFDFNAFLGDFVPQNLRSDVDKNGRVDIFDYNLILQNFGR